MNREHSSPDKNIQLLAARVDELRQTIRQIDPYTLASSTAADFSPSAGETGMFELDIWDSPTRLSYPDFLAMDAETGHELPVVMQALMLYYFKTADGASGGDQWLSFSELQDGRFYAQAFQGYTGKQLATTFEDNIKGFEQAALRAGGTPGSIGDAGYKYQLLPKVRLLCVAWRGDDDFPSNYQILFSASVNHYLPTDACAIAGSMLTRKIIRAAQSL